MKILFVEGGKILSALQRGMWGLLSVRSHSSIQEDYTHFSGGWRDIAICFQWQHPEKSYLFSTSTDFCRCSQLWVCLNIVVFLMLSCNVICPLQAAHGVCSLVCLLVPTEDIKTTWLEEKSQVFALTVCTQLYLLS